MRQLWGWETFLKWTLWLAVFTLPFHGLIVTYLKCKMDLDVTLIRFWKEIFVLVFLSGAFYIALKEAKWKLFNIFEGNNLVWLTSTVILCTFIYIFFPYFQLKPASLLGFRYDAFFLFCILIGFYLSTVKKNIDFILKTVFISAIIIMGVFLPWYLFWDMSSISSLWYSTKVSTYSASECLAFSQNVDGHYRLQATFWWPIRFSVFLTVFYLLYLGTILNKLKTNSLKKYLIIGIPTIFVLLGIYYSYTKTSLLGLFFWLGLIVWLANKLIYKKRIPKKMVITWISGLSLLIAGIIYIKRDLFLHIGAMLNRLDNLSHSVEMFFYNPFGYGLGIAGPATQIGNSIESAGWWEISTANPTNVSRFLPENWFVQIFLEQGVVGGFLFISLMVLLGYYLFDIAKKKKDFFSIALFASFCSLNFMAFFTHSFEEAATSYTLFLIIGAYIWNHLDFKLHPQKRR